MHAYKRDMRFEMYKEVYLHACIHDIHTAHPSIHAYKRDMRFEIYKEITQRHTIYVRRSRRPGMRRTNACFSSSATRKTARCSRVCMHYIAAMCMCISCSRVYSSI